MSSDVLPHIDRDSAAIGQVDDGPETLTSREHVTEDAPEVPSIGSIIALLPSIRVKQLVVSVSPR